VTPFYDALGPSSFGWAAQRVFHNQLSQHRLASVCFCMMRNAVLQGTFSCDRHHTQATVTQITSGCDVPCCVHAPRSFMLMQSKWEEEVAHT